MLTNFFKNAALGNSIYSAAKLVGLNNTYSSLVGVMGVRFVSNFGTSEEKMLYSIAGVLLEKAGESLLESYGLSPLYAFVVSSTIVSGTLSMLALVTHNAEQNPAALPQNNR